MDDLKINTVVCLKSKNRPNIAVTAWVRNIDGRVVSFKMGEIFAILYLYANKDGDLFDGNRNCIEVYEYLGEI